MSTLIYLLQVSACIAIFYGFYYFLLNRLTFFTINRYYLLGTLLLSFVIPLLTIHVHQQENYPTVVQQVVHVNQLQNEPAVTYVASIKKVAVKQQPVNWLQVLKVFYLLAAVGFLLHLIGALLNFFTKVRHSKIDRVGKVNILRGNKKLNNGSFLNYIFLNDDELSAEEMEQIIAHEMLHVKLLHSVDRIVAKLIQIILWFNPFVYLYARSIEENHEFEVDREVARSTDKSNYADLLLHLSIARQGMLYHSFSKVPLKKRIAMLFNKPSARVKRVVYVLILPVVMISCLAFARLKNDDAKSPDKKLYSVIEGIDKLGKNPVVEIDGKKYPKSILYKISWNCIERSEIYEPDNYKTLKSKGIDIKQWENGHVSITTKEHKITYQTAIEKENLVREDAIPKSQLYARLKIKTEKGYSEEVIVHVNNEIRARAGIDAGNKALFLIGDKRYDEGQMNKLPVSVIQSLSGMSKVGGYGDFPKIDTKGYEVIFRLQTKKEATADSIKYQQKMHYTPAQRIEIEKQGKVAEAYNKTPDAKYKEQLAHNIMGQTVNMKVTGNYVDKLSKFQGINVEYKGYNYLIKSNYGQEKALNSMLKPGDVVTIKVFSTAWREEMPVIISPAFVIKNDKKIFQLAEADKIPDYPFLYEANKVRFAEGQISHITNYPNGKWKTALFETVNGYKFNLSFKPDASDLESIKEDDHVRLRFVHEVKTGAKRYAISDWVSITTNMRDYGVKNPEWFFKFYEAAQTNVKVKGVAKSPVKKQYSTIAGLEKLGNNPMVLIDDKPYPAGILYQISPSCIKRKSVF
ncbi:MAG TPA: M56 family metallopeptidase, partial [Mucilaginibacter sp.]|nr:M56 family metallopeptidase [Mucilaginibacter sp.]